MVDVNLDAISLYLAPELGVVTLNPNLPPDGTIPPETQPDPAVMASFALVPSPNYRWKYTDIRALRLGYVMSRAGAYEYGEMEVLSSQAYKKGVDENEALILPTLATSVSPTLSIGSVGCSLSISEDSLSDDFDPKFGVSFKITSATPTTYPTLRVWVMKILTISVEEA